MTNPLLDSLAKPPPPPSELDELISRDPLDLSAQDIDSIIAMQRQHRARKEAGGRTRKSAADAPKQTLDLAALGLLKPKPAPAIAAPGTVPAVVSSFRRL
jgi:hypothetical protein